LIESRNCGRTYARRSTASPRPERSPCGTCASDLRIPDPRPWNPEMSHTCM
jgi:hypothetical protein